MDAPPLPPFQYCSLFKCPQAGDFSFNGRFVCKAHMEQLTRPPPLPPAPKAETPTSQRVRRERCAFPSCFKPGLIAHNRDFFCRHHLTPLLVLDAHVAGLTLPPRTRVTRRGCAIQLCQIGNCARNGNNISEELGGFVCKDHNVLLRQKEKFVDKQNSEDYALLNSESSRRSQICNFVGCSNIDVKHKYHGVFCCEHLPVIDNIRARIMMAKCHGDELVQISLRYNEIFLRKFLDEGHVEYYNELVAKHGFVAPLANGDHLKGLSRGAHQL